MSADQVLIVLSAYGTVIYSRSPRRGPYFLCLAKENRGKERRPARAQLRCALDCREPNDEAVCLASHSVRFHGTKAPDRRLHFVFAFNLNKPTRILIFSLMLKIAC